MSELPRSKLTLWALSVISATVDSASAEPVEPTPRLRLALAWLTVAHDEAGAWELFWHDAREAKCNGVIDHMNAYRRGTSLRLRLEGMCERLGSDYWAVRDYAKNASQ